MSEPAAAPSPHAQAHAGAPIPFKPEADTALPSGQQWGLAIVLCAVLLAAFVFAHRWGGGPARWRHRHRRLQVLESRAIGAQSQLVLAQYSGRHLLICAGPGGATCLRDDPVPAAEEGAA